MKQRAICESNPVWAVAVIVLALGFACSVATSASSADLKLNPEKIEVGATFTGATLNVSGEVPKGSAAVLEVVGPTHDEHLMRKGRKMGLWMNVGSVEVHSAPTIYMAASTDPALLASTQSDAQWGFEAMKRRVTFSGDVKDGEQEGFFKDFIKLKKSENFYNILSQSLKVSPSDGERSRVEAEIPLPAKVAPGTYQACLAVLQDGKMADRKCSDFQVLQVGFPALLSMLAYEHGLAYGVIAVVIAIITGFAMGFLFKGKGGAH